MPRHRKFDFTISAAMLLATVTASVSPFTWTLGPEQIHAYPSPHPYQFPDSAFAQLEGLSGDGSRLMFWTDGTTYRVEGAASELFPSGVPSPLTPVLGEGPPRSYDANGNWLLAAFRLATPGYMIAFTHVEDHNFSCPGGYAEWNAAAVVSSVDDGVSWTRQGLAISDPMPCAPTFGGSGFSSVLPARDGSGGFIAWGGCTAFRTSDPLASSGSWSRYLDGSFSSPGINGSDSCLPGVPGNVCCPIVHWNTYLNAFVSIFTTWGNSSALFIATSADGITFGTPQLLLSVPPPRSIAYGQIIGASNSSSAGAIGTLVYAAAPPTSPYPRDFVYRTIEFSMA